MKKLICLILLTSLIGISYYIYTTTQEVEAPFVSHPIITFHLSDHTAFKIVLYPEEAPNTVCNFIDLSSCGFYKNLGFSKILPHYFIQTGDTIGNGTGFPGYFIKSECKANGVDNDLKCEMGTVCMARGEKYNTEGSQFFILLRDAPELDGKYTAFGKVVSGLEHLMTLEAENTVTIEDIEVQTFDIVYDEPQVLSMVMVRDVLK